MLIRPISRQLFIASIAILGLAACNGGDTTKPQNETSNLPDSDIQAPLADILFPWATSMTGEVSITIKGTATDESGVAGIKVNGLTAELKESSDPNIVYWSAHIPVANNVVVETTDALGNTNAEAASVTLLSGEVASIFTIDNTNQRLLGKHYSSNNLIVMDLVTGQQQYVEIQDELSFVALIYADEENVLVQADEFDGIVTLRTVDIENGYTDVLNRYTVPKTAGEWTFVSLQGLDYSGKDNAIYINVNMIFDQQSNLSHIAKYDLNTKEFSVVIDGVDTNNNVFNSRTMAAADSGILLANYEYLGNYSYRSTGIQKLTQDDAKMQQVTDESLQAPHILTLDHNNQNFLYGVDFDGVTRIDLATGESIPISMQDEQSDLPFSQIRFADIDFANNRLLVADSDLDMVIAVDLMIGERSRFMHDGVGTGKAMIKPSRFAYSKGSHRLFVADTGGNASETVFEIDLTNGNRKEIGNINRPYNEWIEDIVIDEQAEKVYVIFGQEILTVNIFNEQTEVFASSLVGTGASIGWLKSAVLDKDNNRLLVADGANKQILAIDLISGHRTRLSSAEANVGEGDSLGFVHSITLDKENSSAIVAGLYDRLPALFSVDLQSGNRQLWDNVCPGMQAFKEQDTSSIGRMFIDSVNNQLHMVTSDLLTYDLESGECKSNHEAITRYLIDALKTDKDQWLLLSRSAVHQMDIETGQSVIISK